MKALGIVVYLVLECLLLPIFASPLHQLRPRVENGLALTPPMGWNSYNHYSCYPNETIIRSNAQAVVDLGLADAGYHYITPDCGWSATNRTVNGTLTWNATLFPSGYPALADWLHGLGLGLGVYSDSGIYMCQVSGQAPPAGSLGYETTDADTFAGWGADMLKYDNCYSDAATGYPDADYDPESSPSSRYATMEAALNHTGRDILFAICEWGVDFPSTWAPSIGNTWRITNDIIPSWRTIYRQINQFVPSAPYAGPGHWPDLDMLEVGNNVFTVPEEQTHFSLWAIAKSPLVIGAALKDNYTAINTDSLAILNNSAVIRYNQDSLGTAANLTRRYTEAGLDVWANSLSSGRTVAALVNWNDATVTAARLDFPDFGIQSATTIYDVWNDKTTSDVKTSYVTDISAHGVLLLELTETAPAGTYDGSLYATTTNSTTVFTDIYGVTDSSSYGLTIQLPNPSASDEVFQVSTSASNEYYTASIGAGESDTLVTVPLSASYNNTITISSTSNTVSGLKITNPSLTLYPSTAFATSGNASLETCATDTCLPVGSKISYLSPSGTASITIPRNSTSASGNSTTSKYISLVYINNDIAFSTSWTTGRNARNITVSVNGYDPVRLEVPLSGNTSELFSPGLGWYDSAELGILVPGFGTGNGSDEIVIGNVGGNDGVQSYGADFVGLRIMW